MTPARLRAYVLIVMRDVLPPLTGVFLSVYLPLTHQFEVWQLPLLAGLFGVPLVGKDTTPPPDDIVPMPDRRPPPEL